MSGDKDSSGSERYKVQLGGYTVYEHDGKPITEAEFERCWIDETGETPAESAAKDAAEWKRRDIESQRLLDAKDRPCCPDCGKQLTATGTYWYCPDGHPAWPEAD